MSRYHQRFFSGLLIMTLSDRAAFDRPDTYYSGDPSERRVSRDRRETASKGRVQDRARTWRGLSPPPGDGVSPAVDAGRGSSRYLAGRRRSDKVKLTFPRHPFSNNEP